MTETITVEALTPDSLWLDCIVGWQHDTWGYMEQNQTRADWKASVREHCAGRQLPSVWLARCGSQPVGTASLVVQDSDVRRDLSPWLASVFVTPEWRGRGIATRLAEQVAEAAKADGQAVLYLFTPDQQALYRRLGWQIIDRCFYADEWVDVMAKPLASTRKVSA